MIFSLLPLRLDTQRTAEMFNIFNTSGDGSMSLEEFRECYNCWVEKVLVSDVTTNPGIPDSRL